MLLLLLLLLLMATQPFLPGAVIRGFDLIDFDFDSSIFSPQWPMMSSHYDVSCMLRLMLMQIVCIVTLRGNA